MEITSVSIQLASSEPDRLRDFYRDIVQLAPDEMGDGSFKLGAGGTLFVVDHSEVSGATKERARAIIDLHITDIDGEHARLEAAGVNFTRCKGLEWWGGVISTFGDPDGNTIQLIQFKPELATANPEE
ncbi:MAG: VOC family protein [bacterium]